MPGVALFLVCLGAAAAPAAGAPSRIPAVYSTDLFHPAVDPDDHFDLATLFALRELDVRAIILDLGGLDPARAGVAPLRQMMAIAGVRVPFARGLRVPLRGPEDTALDQPAAFQGGVALLLQVLRGAERPVTVFTTGSLRDIAAAYNREPDLLRRKVGRLYANIGHSGGGREYNVGLDPAAYVRIQRADLPLYWVPCFGPDGYASLWSFRQVDLLAGIPPRVRRFFLHALARTDFGAGDPVAWLERPVPEALRRAAFARVRRMWCTAALLHAAGRRTVRAADGTWRALPSDAPVPAGARPAPPPFGFERVRAAVAGDGTTRIGAGGGIPVRAFRRAPGPAYGEALQSVLRALLRELETAGRRRIALAGRWRFRLDPRDEGVAAGWYRAALPEAIRLPGTTDENRKGERNPRREAGRLTRVYRYVGPAWYQRDVDIPAGWAGARIALSLERTRPSRAWWDDGDLGARLSLSTPHVYPIPPDTTPGPHVLTVRVDNTPRLPVGGSHAISEETQTNWNGIVGRIELVATDPVWIDDVRVDPDVDARTARVRLTVGNATGRRARGALRLRARAEDPRRSHAPAPVRVPFAVEGGSGPAGSRAVVAVDLPLGAAALLWDAFDPVLYELVVDLEAGAGGRRFADRAVGTFGLRRFGREGTQFAINGRTTLLRGKNDACVFPRTGYAPMDEAAWRRVFRIARAYGINHYRFHTWCPPEAAFAAADRTGIYLQPELPNWAPFGDPRHDRTMEAEGDAILAAYGDHPSFVMFALGNELGGSREAMARLVARFRARDPRRLYAQGSNNFFWDPSLAEGDDYWTTFRTRKGGGAVRASFSHADPPPGHIEARPPSTEVDYRDAIAGIPVPVIGHEVGQYQVFPDFTEIPKYTGVLAPRNLEIFRERLAARGLLGQARAYARASGALAVVCYREEIEAALRTPGFGGFQLLDLQDFPGQGSALVGILDAFMDSKGLIAPEAWRAFCCEVVPLLRMPKYAWTADETYAARIEVAHYGPADLEDVAVAWSIRDPAEGDPDRRARGSGGRFPPRRIAQGGLRPIGAIRAPLGGFAAPRRLEVAVRLEGTPYANTYSIWLFPAKVDVRPPPGVHLAHRLDAEARAQLAGGGRLVLVPPPEAVARGVGGAFQPDFWCFPMFERICKRKGLPVAPGTLGILCDPAHPALAAFPTAAHGDWQWWPIVKHARPLMLDDAPRDLRPIVQVIDNVARAHRLGLVIEARVGPGRLLLCASDLAGRIADRPEARQLLHSLLAYAGSERFAPRGALEPARLEDWLATPARTGETEDGR